VSKRYLSDQVDPNVRLVARSSQMDIWTDICDVMRAFRNKSSLHARVALVRLSHHKIDDDEVHFVIMKD
jgi:hypothetical protein